MGKYVVKPIYGFGGIPYKYIQEKQTFLFMIPTEYNIEANDFQYYGLVLKFVDEVSKENFDDYVGEIYPKYVDLRRMDSFLGLVIAPKCGRTQVSRLKYWTSKDEKNGRKKANIKWRDYSKGTKKRIFVGVMIAKTPEKAVEGILKILKRFFEKRMKALAERNDIQEYWYDGKASKLYSQIRDGCVKISSWFIERFLTYLAKLVKTIEEKLEELKRKNDLREKIRDELEELGIPAKKYYWQFRNAVEEIVRLAQRYSGPKPLAKVLKKLKGKDERDDYKYGLKVIQWLKKGEYEVT
jgi:hypothetical protein